MSPRDRKSALSNCPMANPRVVRAHQYAAGVRKEERIFSFMSAVLAAPHELIKPSITELGQAFVKEFEGMTVAFQFTRRQDAIGLC